MSAVNGVTNNGAAGASNNASQTQVTEGVGLIAQSTFQMLLNQLMQNNSQFQDAMQDPTMDTSDDS